MTPKQVNAITFNYYIRQGFMVEKVEHQRRYKGKTRTHDLFGFIDFLVVMPSGYKWVQSTTVGNVQARIDKIRNHTNYKKIKKLRPNIHIVVLAVTTVGCQEITISPRRSDVKRMTEDRSLADLKARYEKTKRRK